LSQPRRLASKLLSNAGARELKWREGAHDQAIQVGQKREQAAGGGCKARISVIHGNLVPHDHSGSKAGNGAGRSAACCAAISNCDFNNLCVINAGETHHDEIQTRVHLA
jgi:hypothetical protein